DHAAQDEQSEHRAEHDPDAFASGIAAFDGFSLGAQGHSNSTLPGRQVYGPVKATGAEIQWALPSLFVADAAAKSTGHAADSVPRISFGLWTCSGSQRRGRGPSTPSRLSSRPRENRSHALCSRQG